jgi:hypothetical protein
MPNKNRQMKLDNPKRPSRIYLKETLMLTPMMEYICTRKQNRGMRWQIKMTTRLKYKMKKSMMTVLPNRLEGIRKSVSISYKATLVKAKTKIRIGQVLLRSIIENR